MSPAKYFFQMDLISIIELIKKKELQNKKQINDLLMTLYNTLIKYCL